MCNERFVDDDRRGGTASGDSPESPGHVKEPRRSAPRAAGLTKTSQRHDPPADVVWGSFYGLKPLGVGITILTALGGQRGPHQFLKLVPRL